MIAHGFSFIPLRESFVMPPVSLSFFIQALSHSTSAKWIFCARWTGIHKEAETARELLPVLKDAINDPDRPMEKAIAR